MYSRPKRFRSTIYASVKTIAQAAAAAIAASAISSATMRLAYG
jgi:hypothetical protein